MKSFIHIQKQFWTSEDVDQFSGDKFIDVGINFKSFSSLILFFRIAPSICTAYFCIIDESSEIMTALQCSGILMSWYFSW